MNRQQVRMIMLWALFVPILTLGVFFRVVYYQTTALEVDEEPNTAIAQSVFALGYPTLKPEYNQTQQPYLFHPPLGYDIMAGWFGILGDSSIEGARLFNIIVSVAMMILAFEFMRRTHGGVAVISAIFIAIDAWIVMIGRMNYLENLQLLITIPAIWFYWQANKTGKFTFYLAAGFLIGLTVIYKHIGLYLILAVVVNWILVRRDYRQHLCLLLIVGCVVDVYELAMCLRYEDLFFAQQFVQFERLFGGLNSRGMNFGLGEALRIIVDRYWIYISTVIAILLGWPLIALRYVGALLQRIDAGDSVLLSWAVGGLVFAVLSRLKSPHYLVLWLIPLYLFLALWLIQWAKGRKLLLIPAICLLFIAVNIFTWNQRFARSYGDPLRQSAQFINDNLPQSAVVATESYIGLLIKQPYVDIETANTAEKWKDVEYLAIYTSTTATTDSLPTLAQWATKLCVPMASFKGFKDSVVVCKLSKDNGQASASAH